LENINNRPLLKEDSLKEGLEILWEKRKSLYLETADYIININDESPNDIAKKIAGYIK
jgi:shikimate kinase